MIEGLPLWVAQTNCWIVAPDGPGGECVIIDAPPDPTNIIITGADKQAVGHLAASIRARRPPEPYKGKGVRYKDEVVRRKAGKSFGS